MWTGEEMVKRGRKDTAWRFGGKLSIVFYRLRCGPLSAVNSISEKATADGKKTNTKPRSVNGWTSQWYHWSNALTSIDSRWNQRWSVDHLLGHDDDESWCRSSRTASFGSAAESGRRRPPGRARRWASSARNRPRIPRIAWPPSRCGPRPRPRSFRPENSVQEIPKMEHIRPTLLLQSIFFQKKNVARSVQHQVYISVLRKVIENF